MSRETVGHYELLVLSAILRLEDAAYGATIAREIEEATGRVVILASIYAALERLQTKGLVTSSLGAATRERGGRAKRFFRVSAAGEHEVRSAQRAFGQLWNPTPAMKGGLL